MSQLLVSVCRRVRASVSRDLCDIVVGIDTLPVAPWLFPPRITISFPEASAVRRLCSTIIMWPCMEVKMFLSLAALPGPTGCLDNTNALKCLLTRGNFHLCLRWNRLMANQSIPAQALVLPMYKLYNGVDHSMELPGRKAPIKRSTPTD